MKNTILLTAILISLFGCSTNESDGQATRDGQATPGEIPLFTEIPLNTAQGSGGGLVFRRADTSAHLRLLVGQNDSYYQIDLTYEGDLSRRVELPRLTSRASLNQIFGGDAVTGYKLNESYSHVGFSIDWQTARMHGDIQVASLPNDSGELIRISGPFDVPVGPIGATEWNCNFGNPIKDCAFLLASQTASR